MASSRSIVGEALRDGVHAAIHECAKRWRLTSRRAGAGLGLVAAIGVGACVLLGAPGTAVALCSQSGSTETCSGDLSGNQNFNTSLGINDLEINNVTTGPSQIQFQGTGSTPSDGSAGTASYNCSTAGDCTIDNTASPPTCTVNSGAPAGTLCVAVAGTPAQVGPSGNSGPQVTFNVVTPTSGAVTVGAGRTNIAIIGSSFGSTGGHGGDATLIGDGGDGGPGADGGTASVSFTGVVPNGNYGGILVQSIGGNGGNGGSGGSIGGSGGSGGAGGYGGAATASFDGGSITVSGAGNVGISAISQGGNGGSGGGGGFFYSGGGSGNNAGQAGAAEVDTARGSSISTSGNYGDGIAVYSLGGAGGSGAGGFGLFYSGGGGGSTGGNGGGATVNASGAITTTGQYAHGILAQSIGGGGGSAGSVSGLFALGGSGAAGGIGATVNVGNSGAITTQGFGANAIEAQSIGGGGGNGANSGGLFAMGGSGSNTTPGGSVTVTNEGVLQTYSSQADGILAQSIGGGGGNGGTSSGFFAFGGTAAAPATPATPRSGPRRRAISAAASAPGSTIN